MTKLPKEVVKEVSVEATEIENPEIKRVESSIKREMRKNGHQSPSSADSLSQARLTTLLISSDSPSQSRNPKSLILSSRINLKKKSWKSSPSKNRLKLVKEPVSKLSPLSVTVLTTSVSDGNATNKSKVLLKVLSLWLNST